MTRDELVVMVRKLMELEYREEEEESVVEFLKKETGDPLISDYIYWSASSLSPEDVVDLALGLRQVSWTRFEP